MNWRNFMLEVLEKSIVIKDVSNVKPELKTYLETYTKQYTLMSQTYDWIKQKLDTARQQEWERTISSLKKICLALDAGFEPKEPPRNWSSGQLIQYLAPVPEDVQKDIDKAEIIFGRSQILIYDPNTEHFSRPKKYDPMVFGFINLANQRHHFLIGAWDLDKDLKFITTPRKRNTLDISARNIQGTLTEANKLYPGIPSTGNTWALPEITPYYGNGTISTFDTHSVTQTNWSLYMVGAKDTFLDNRS